MSGVLGERCSDCGGIAGSHSSKCSKHPANTTLIDTSFSIMIDDATVVSMLGGRKEKLELAAQLILSAIEEDHERAGLVGTPARFARMWIEFADFDAGNCATTFDSVSTDQMVAVTGVRVWSLCEHHLLPFYCDIAIGYLTSEKILGLSKFARIAQKHAHKLQVQERLVEQIATEIAEVTGSPDVAVYASGEHLCMTMRGARTEALMHSSKMLGKFLSDPSVRAEFLSIVKGRERTR